MATLLVTYVGDTSTRFDRDYYTSHHLPLVSRTWEPHGLRRIEAYFWDGGDGKDVTLAICLCHFADYDEINAALAAEESVPVMDDIANFTDVEPTRSVMEPVATTRSTLRPPKEPSHP